MSLPASPAHSPSGYGPLLRDGGFQSFLWTQFLGAFNDNVYKMIVSVLAVNLAVNQQASSLYLALAGAVFVLPFLLFGGYAGQVADRFRKSRVLQIAKACEVPIMALAVAALFAQRIELLLAVLFLLALQANFFSPAKYGVLPELVGEAQLSRANGLLELSTFAAIVLGTSCGTWLFEHWRGQPGRMGSVLLTLAVLGFLTSLGMRRTEPPVSREPLHLNPFHEIWQGARRLRQNRTMALVVAGISYFWFLGGLFQMTMLLAGRETLHVSETHAGLLLTALAVGISIGSIVAGKISGDHIELGLVPAGSLVMGLATVALSATTSYVGALAWLSVIGIAAGCFIVPLNAWLQDRAGAAEKGRMLATNNFFNMLGVISASGTLWLLHDLARWSPSTMLLVLGLVTVAGTAVVVRLMPAESLRFLLLCLTRMMFRVRVQGAERLPETGGALLVANHVSFADAMLIGSLTPRFVRFLMWQPYFEHPVWRPYFQLLRAIPLPVHSPKESLRALKAARAEMMAGELVGLFPEGALTLDGEVGEFQRGVEKLADGAVPVIPIRLDGLWGHPLSKKGGGLLRSWRRVVRPVVTVTVGEPIHGAVRSPELREQVTALPTQDSATLASELVRHARRRWSQKAAADSTGKQLAYGDALTAARLMQGWLQRHAGGERHIGLLLPASVGGVVANLGVTLAGRVAVNLNFTAGDEFMHAAVRRCDIRTVITSRAFAEKAKLPELPGMVYLEDILPAFTRSQKAWAWLTARYAPASWLSRAARPHDAAAVIFSSGSTGDPKGVVLTHANLLANIRAVAQVYTVTEQDCLLGALPFFHSFGYTHTLWLPLANGFRAVYHPNPTDAKTIGELAAQHETTFLLSTPTFCLAYPRKCTPEQFASLRYVLVGAEKLRPALATSFAQRFGVTPMEGYGCTEMGPVVAVNAPGVCRAGSVGRPIPGVTLRLVDPHTYEPVAEGSEGLLLVRGPSRMSGYLSDERRTAEAMHQGFYITGDLARVDEDGYLYIVDRLARFSKIGGEMVPHVKVEEAAALLLGHTACVVVGIPDEQRGERLALLHTAADMPAARIVEHLSGLGLPALWVPKRENCHAVDSIPTLGTGKTDLRRAKALAVELNRKQKPADAAA